MWLPFIRILRCAQCLGLTSLLRDPPAGRRRRKRWPQRFCCSTLGEKGNTQERDGATDAQSVGSEMGGQTPRVDSFVVPATLIPMHSLLSSHQSGSRGCCLALLEPKHQAWRVHSLYLVSSDRGTLFLFFRKGKGAKLVTMSDSEVKELKHAEGLPS